VIVTLAPFAKDSTPLTVVGTSTFMIEPFSGSLVTVRVALPVVVCAATRTTWAEQVDELRDVVRADVEHRAAASLKEELRVGVPVFHSVRGEEDAAGHGPTDPPRVYCMAAGLVPRAEEGIRRAANTHTLRPGGEHQRLPFRVTGYKRLLRIDVLAGFDNLPADLRVS
jgi:hypothetical protein